MNISTFLSSILAVCNQNMWFWFKRVIYSKLNCSDSKQPKENDASTNTKKSCFHQIISRCIIFLDHLLTIKTAIKNQNKRIWCQINWSSEQESRFNCKHPNLIILFKLTLLDHFFSISLFTFFCYKATFNIYSQVHQNIKNRPAFTILILICKLIQHNII